jgi:hypothetical protein
MQDKYSIELFRDGGESAGIEKILVRHHSLTVARALFAALNCPHALRSSSRIGAQRPVRDYA